MSESNSRKRPIEEQASDFPAQVTLPVATSARPADSTRLSSVTAATAAPATTKRVDSKAYKGLRHFSMMVCRCVEEKGTTTYTQVADELVAKIIKESHRSYNNSYVADGLASNSSNTTIGNYSIDEKNIRRRVYDALNVLMAMDIITKHKKEITWKGLPTSAGHDIDMLQREKDFRIQEVERKRMAVKELLQQQVCFRNLVEHNRAKEEQRQKADTDVEVDNVNGELADGKHSSSSSSSSNDPKIPLPFILVNTDNSAVIQCNMSRDKQDVMFDFSMPFEINDDNSLLKKMGLNKTTMGVLTEMLPADMLKYCQDHGLLDEMLLETGKAALRSADTGGTTAAAKSRPRK